MLKKLILAFAVLALAVAVAGTVPGVVGTYKITLLQPSMVKGTELKPGEYRLNLSSDKITIVYGKESLEVPVKIETVPEKFESTAIRYTSQAGKSTVAEIRLGGTRTRLVLLP